MKYGRATTSNRRVWCLVLAGAWLGLATLAMPARACSVPVFLYALEFWPADPYQAVLLHRGSFDPDVEAALTGWRGGVTEANLTWREVNLQAGSAGAGRWAANRAETDLPWLILHAPGQGGQQRPLWEGRLAEAPVERWLESPARSEIAARLLDRTAGVWLFLASGQRRADAAAERLLRQTLETLERELELPAEFDGWDRDEPGGSGIRFAVVRVERDDPREVALVRMLLHSEPDLVERRDEPMVFPIYGRGLILHALVGEGINSWTIQDAAEFLVGPCSCQVKALNPGVDLLMRVDWERQVTPSGWSVPTLLGSLGGFQERAEEAGQLLAGVAPEPAAVPSPLPPVVPTVAGNEGAEFRNEPTPRGSLDRNLWLLLAGGTVLAVAVAGIQFRRRPR